MFKRQQIEWNRINQSLVLHLDSGTICKYFHNQVNSLVSFGLFIFFLLDEYGVHSIIIILLW